MVIHHRFWLTALITLRPFRYLANFVRHQMTILWQHSAIVASTCTFQTRYQGNGLSYLRRGSLAWSRIPSLIIFWLINILRSILWHLDVLYIMMSLLTNCMNQHAARCMHFEKFKIPHSVSTLKNIHIQRRKTSSSSIRKIPPSRSLKWSRCGESLKLHVHRRRKSIAIAE